MEGSHMHMWCQKSLPGPFCEKALYHSKSVEMQFQWTAGWSYFFYLLQLPFAVINLGRKPNFNVECLLLKGALIFKPTGKKIWDALEHEPQTGKEHGEQGRRWRMYPMESLTDWQTDSCISYSYNCPGFGVKPFWSQHQDAPCRTEHNYSSYSSPPFNGKHDVDEHSPKTKFDSKHRSSLRDALRAVSGCPPFLQAVLGVRQFLHVWDIQCADFHDSCNSVEFLGVSCCWYLISTEI